MKRSAILILASVFAAIAQTAWAVAPVPTPQYEIEVLVFENRLPELEGGELWVGEPKLTPALFEQAVTLAAPPSPDSELSRAAKLLEQDGHYRVLAHLRWQQTAEAKSATRPVRIRGVDPALDGVLRFYLSRFLHVDLELVRRPDPQDTQVGEAEQPAAYWINEHRRVRTKVLHYFDHPKFGALVKVTQIGKD